MVVHVRVARAGDVPAIMLCCAMVFREGEALKPSHILQQHSKISAPGTGRFHSQELDLRMVPR